MLFNNAAINDGFIFQQKMQLRKKRKKEREALGDKVSFLCFLWFPAYLVNFKRMEFWE